MDAEKYKGLVGRITYDSEILGKLSAVNKYYPNYFQLYIQIARSQRDYELFHRNIVHGNEVEELANFIMAFPPLNSLP